MKTVFAFCAALSFMALGVSAAVATPVPTTLTGTPVSTLPPGVSDAFNIFVGGNRVGGIVVTPADEANCADPVAILGACSFSTPGFQIGSITINPKKSVSNQIAVFLEPNSTTKISDILLIGCEDVPGSPVNRDAQTGLCLGETNWSVLTGDLVTGFIDYNALVTGLSALNLSVGWVGTESLADQATAFPAGFFLDITGNIDHLPIGANFISSNDLPEPFTLSLFGAGLAGAVAMRRRKKQA